MRQTEFLFRPATDEDVPFMETILLEAAEASGVRIEPCKLDENPDTAKYVRGWPQAGEVGIIAEASTGHRVGAAWIRSFSHLNPESGELAPEITVGIAPDYRRKGIAALLMDELYREAKTQGWKNLSLGVHQGNNAAIRLYQKQGWVESGIYEEYILMLKKL